KQLLEQMPTRGYESSVDHRLHFGFGSATRADSVMVVWPSRRVQVLTNVAVDTTITVSEADAVAPPLKVAEVQSRRVGNPWCGASCSATRPLFSDVSSTLGINWRHRENEAYDFEREPLLPHLLSDRGPALAVADVNGDGLDDLYVGGAKWQSGTLFVQQRDGTFRVSAQPALATDSLFEDVDAEFFDANGDGYPDLYVVSGGNEFADGDDALQDRLYLNDGHGNFHRDTAALPPMAESGSCVVVGDFNGDGHPDLFVGRRNVSRAYGRPPRSYLLQNDGHGHFRDVTNELAPALADAGGGMVTAAAWVDYDHDSKLDLVVTGEWMPVRVFRQENGRFVERTREAGFARSNGWWSSVTVADVNGDGRPDLVLGNLGLNSYLKASDSLPARAYVGDFAHNRMSEAIITVYRGGASYPLAGRDELLGIIPELRTRFPLYKDFAGKRIEELLPEAVRRSATVLEAYDFGTSVAVNKGDGTFSLQPLPAEAQFSNVNAVLAGDFDGDGRTDLLLAGNDYGVPPVLGRYDASYGQFLRGAAAGAGRGLFQPVDLAESGLVLEGQVRHIRALRRATGSRLVVAARNDDALQVLQFSPLIPSTASSRP
ncbi:MAG TPA: FG-GAP-like repeat-containing protein, partial [Gemmatimonadaceae bacterium]|nr:FG-GAP-like repeat-containing protein [Gemmatimonadaceae bacterium]